MGFGGPTENGDRSGDAQPGEGHPARGEHVPPDDAAGEVAPAERRDPDQPVAEHRASSNGSGAFAGEFSAPPADATAMHPTTSNGAGAAPSPWTAPPWEPAGVTPAPVLPPSATANAAVPHPAAGPAPAVPPTPGWVDPASPPAGYAYPPPEPAPRPSPRHPAPRTHRWGLGAYLLAEAVFLLTSVLVGVLFVTSGQAPSAGVLAILLAVPTLLAAGTALLITRIRGNGPREDLRLRWSWRDVGIGVAFGLGGLVVTIPASVLFVALVGENATSAVGEVVGGTSASLPMALLIFVIVVLVAPLCEEIVYRGLLWGGVERLTGPRMAFAVSTLLFALAHFEFTRTPLLLVVAIPIAAARYYTGGLLSSIVAHQVNNLLPGVVLLLGLIGALPTG